MKKTSSIIYILSILFYTVPSYALDTDIYAGSNVPPNILIVLDTSATMGDVTKMIKGAAYVYNSTYPAGTQNGVVLKTNSVYRVKTANKEWEKMVLEEVAASVEVLNPNAFNPNKPECSAPYSALKNSGFYIGNLAFEKQGNSVTINCNSSESSTFYVGNYLNYLAYPTAEQELRETSARRAIRKLVTETATTVARFGLMRFEEVKDDGGNVVLPVGSTAGQFATLLDNISNNNPMEPKGTTPLAETLAEAGLYFAGKKRWSNYPSNQAYTDGVFISGSNTMYKSPIQYRCQQNYVIIITDGMSMNDTGELSGAADATYGSNIFLSTNYMNSTAIEDYDDDNADLVSATEVKDLDGNGATHMLDDVAKFLYEQDLITTGEDEGGAGYEGDAIYDKQNIKTFTIGFMTGSPDAEHLNQTDQLLKRTADTSHGYGEFLQANNHADLEKALLTFLGEIMEANSSFVAPVVPVNKLNKVYSGNSIYLSLFQPVNESAFWFGNIKKFGITADALILQKNGSSAVDSNDIILDNATSCWQNSDADASKTDAGGAGGVILNLPANSRHYYTNPTTAGNLIDITTDTTVQGELGADVTDKADLINYLTGRDVYAPNGSSHRDWVLGDILHSKPATLFDGADTVIFVGANDGFLHAFVDNDNNTRGDTLGTSLFNDDTLSEAWCFTPRPLLPKLKNLRGKTHGFYVDGSPVIYDSGTNRYLTFGLRRGGDSYYTLDIGNLDGTGEYITEGYKTPTFAWSIGPTKLGAGKEPLGQSWGRPWVSTIATGAMETKQVLVMPGGYDNVNEDATPPTDTEPGKGRAVYAVDAATGDVVLNFNHADYNTMTHSIVELVIFDRNSNGIDDTIYAGSMGGELFGFRDINENGGWGNPVKVFQAGDATVGSHWKFFYEPDVVLERFGGIIGDYVFIGSGDREHPKDTTTINRFYAIKKSWGNATILNEGHLQEVTNNVYDNTVRTGLSTKKGWFIKLSTGEKVMSSPLVFDKKVFFTTFTPVVAGTGVDLCAAKGLGRGKLYALNYLTGEKTIFPERSTDLGLGIPSAPTLIVTKSGGAKLIIATGVDEGANAGSGSGSGSGGGDGGDGGGGTGDDDNSDNKGDIMPKVYDAKEGSSTDLYYWKQN